MLTVKFEVSVTSYQHVTLLFFMQRSLLTLNVTLAFGQLNNRQMHTEMDIYKTAKMSKNI